MLRLFRYCLLALAVAGCGEQAPVSAPRAADPGPAAQATTQVRQADLAQVESPGNPPAAPLVLPFPAPRLAAKAMPTAAGANQTITLAAGWNGLGLLYPQLTSLEPNPLVPGFAWFDGTSYQTGAFELSELNAGEGGRRGLFLFAATATNVTYAGQQDTVGTATLHSGWNLFSLAGPGPVPGANLTVKLDGSNVPLNTVLFRSFYRVNTSGYTVVDMTAGGALEGGRAYWIYAARPGVSLHWTVPPFPSSVGLVSVPATVSADSASNASQNFTVTAEVRDQLGQRLTASSANVSLEFTPANLTVGGNLTVTAVNGLATFANLSVAQAGPLNVVATSAGLTNSTAGNLVVTPGRPTQLVFTQQPPNGTAGAALNPTVQLAIRDAQGNDVIPSPSVSVTLSSNSHNATLGNATASTDASGRANFPDLNQTVAGSGYRLTGTCTAEGVPLTSALSNSFAIVPAGGSSLVFVPTPAGNVTSGRPVQGTVELQDAFGNLLDTATNNVTLGIDTAPATPDQPDLDAWTAGTQNALNVTLVNGVGTFTVRLNNPGSWTLKASSLGVGTEPIWNLNVDFTRWDDALFDGDLWSGPQLNEGETA